MDNFLHNEYIYFKIQCGVNSVIRFYNQNQFRLLENNVKGTFTLTDNKLTLVFPDGNTDTFNVQQTKDFYSGDSLIGGKRGCLLTKLNSHFVNRIPHYNNEQVGLVVGTFGSIAHIHLQLEMATREYPFAKILIIDDSSPLQDNLRKLCQEYNAEFITSKVNLGHMRGDVFIVSECLKWAKENNIPWVYKLSRRFLPMVNIFQDLSTITESEYATYSNTCDWGIRSECVLFNTYLWIERCYNALNDYLQYAIRDGLHHPVPEVLYTKLCKRFYYSVSLHNNNILDQNQNSQQLDRGCIFGLLPFLNSNRSEPSSTFLWHSSNSQNDFLKLSQKFNLPYQINDFNCFIPQDI